MADKGANTVMANKARKSMKLADKGANTLMVNKGFNECYRGGEHGAGPI